MTRHTRTVHALKYKAVKNAAATGSASKRYGSLLRRQKLSVN